MSGSEASRLECGCGNDLLFGFQLERPDREPGKLYHADGTEICAAAEPEATDPGKLWPQFDHVPYIPSRVGAVSRTLRTYVDPPEERDRPPVLGVAVLFAFLASIMALCGLAVYVWWPM